MHSDTENGEEYIFHSLDSILELINNFNYPSLRNDLQKFIVKYNISHNAAKELLEILRQHGHIELPKDVRSLIHTPIKCL